MPKKLLIILFLFLSNLLFAQEWSEPVNISNMDGTDYFPDITVGPDGALHCVWVHFYNSNHREVYYSNSIDEGIIWSMPVSISQNDTLAISKPHIVCDSKNNLYVTYDYNSHSSPIVVIQTYKGENWSKIDSVAQGYSHKNKIFIDNNDRVYVFWLTNPNIYYRYYENDTWSEIICPYNDVNNNLILAGAVDSENNLHLAGVYDKYVSYFKYNKSSEQMDPPLILTYDDAYEGLDITVDNNNNPHIVWNDIQNSDHGSLYSHNNGTNWSTSELIAENAFQQKITHFNDKIYIMHMENISDDSACAVLYQRDDYGNWYGINTLKTSHWIGFMNFEIVNNKFFNLFYWRLDDEQYDIYFRKTKYGVGINEIENINDIFSISQNFPNPFNDYTKINYILNQEGYCTLNIYNIEGKIVNILINEKQQAGTYVIEWNGKNSNGEKLPAGIYLYRLSLDNYRMTKSLIIN